MKRRLFTVALAVIMAAFSLQGCGSSSSNQNTESTDSTGNESESQNSSTEDGTELPSSADRTDVIIATSQEPTAFFCQDGDITTNQAKDSPVLFNIYENLVWLDENGVCQPWVATEWTMSDDGLTYDFTIRDDVTFSNGEKLTAEDVAFTLNLCRDENPSLAGNLLINFENAEAIDETHVRFTLSAPFEAFVTELSTRAAFLINKSYYEEVGPEGYNENPVGTGAYVMESRISGQEIVLRARDDYWGGKPAIDTVIIRPISNVATQFISLKTGDIDVINVADVASCKEIADTDIATWFSAPSAARMTLNFNDSPGGNRPGNNKNLRLAIMHAINRDDILYACADGEGYVLDIECPSGYTGCPDEGTVPVIQQDLDKAREYLEASGYNGETIRIICLSGTAQEIAAQVVQGQLYEIGLTNVEVSATDTGTYTAASTAGDYDIIIQVTSSSLNDVSSLNTQYKIQDYKGPTYTRAEELDELCKAADVEIDPEARKAIWSQILTIATEEGYGMGLYSANSVMALHKNLEGVTLNPNNAWRCMDWSWK